MLEPVEPFLGRIATEDSNVGEPVVSFVPRQESHDEHFDETATVSAPEKLPLPREDVEQDEYLMKKFEGEPT